MINTEHIAKTPPAATGLFALLGALPGVKGTGAPKIARGSGVSKTGQDGVRARARSLTLATLATLCALSGGLLFTAAPALAGEGYGVTTTFGSPGEGAGELALVATSREVEPEAVGSGVAVDQATKDVYVADTGNRRVDVFNEKGEFQFAFGGNVEPLGADVCTELTGCQAGAEGSGPGEFVAPALIAVDQTTGDVYVGDTGDNTITKFTESGVLVSSWGMGGQLKEAQAGEEPFGELRGVAVDPTGDLWVYESNKKVDELSGAGAFMKQFEKNPGNRAEPGLAVDSAGNTYLVERGSKVLGKYNAAGEQQKEKETEKIEPITGLAINPATNDLYVDKGTSIEQYGPFGEPFTKPLYGSGPELVGSGAGIAVDSTSHAVYLADSANDDVAILELGPTAEEPETLAASGETSSTAVLHGTLKGAAGEKLKYDFEYHVGASCVGNSENPSSKTAEMEGEAGKEVSPEEVTGLPEPNREYTFCLVAINGHGSTRGNEVHFDTSPAPPVVEEVNASNVKATEVTLEGALNPNNEPTECHFQYGTVSVSEHEVACSPEVLTGFGRQGVSSTEVNGNGETVTSITGLEAGKTYKYRLLAKNAAGEETLESEVTTQPLTVTNENSPTVTASEAVLSAEIGTGEDAASYTVQYGTSNVEEHSTPEVSVYGSSSPVPVEQRLGDLQPATTYRFRFIVSDGHAVIGEERTFTTPTGTSATAETCPNAKQRAEQPYGLTLPDCRAYEMVSPLDTGGQDATDALAFKNAQGLRASVSGEAIAYVSAGSFAEPAGADVWNELLSRRGGGAWSTQAITPPQEPSGTQLISAYEASAFTPELTAGIASSIASMPESGAPESASGERKLYVVRYGEDPAEPSYSYVGALGTGDGLSVALGASSDLSHVVFGVGTASEWVDGSEVPVGVTNGGEALSASVGSAVSEASRAAEVDAWRAVSSDGSRVYFTSPAAEFAGNGEPEPAAQLYVRVNAEQSQSATAYPEANATGTLTSGSQVIGSVTSTRADSFAVGERISGYGLAPGTTVTAWEPHTGTLTVSAPADVSAGGVALQAGGECTEAAKACTIDISASQRASSDTNGLQAARYWGASANGARVFFTSDAELTDDAKTGPADDAANLYEYDLERPAGERLKDLTVDTADADGAAVQGVVQISKDGSYVYFVADGVLSSVPNEHGEFAKPGTCTPESATGECNLYVSREGREPAFITTLAGGDESDWQAAIDDTQDGGPATHTAVVDPSGARLAFMSSGRLKTVNFPEGYDNIDASTGQPDAEIYLYDAEAGSLVCASCNPSGARPVGPSNLGLTPEELSSYRPRNFSEDGTLFFDSSDALVPNAKDGRQNVYEFEDGHVYALSNVSGGYDSTFLDAGANGDNVFFASSDRLLPEDTSENVEVWDARVDGGFPVNVAALPCTNAEACRVASPPTPGVFGAPPSATFSGPGNLAPPSPAVVKPKPKSLTRAQKLAGALKACRKKTNRKKRRSCERQAKSKYGPVKPKAQAKKSDRKGSK